MKMVKMREKERVNRLKNILSREVAKTVLVILDIGYTDKRKIYNNEKRLWRTVNLLT